MSLWVLVQMFNSPSVERAGPTDDPMDFIAFSQKKLCKIGPIKSGGERINLEQLHSTRRLAHTFSVQNKATAAVNGTQQPDALVPEPMLGREGSDDIQPREASREQLYWVLGMTSADIRSFLWNGMISGKR